MADRWINRIFALACTVLVCAFCSGLYWLVVTFGGYVFATPLNGSRMSENERIDSDVSLPLETEIVQYERAESQRRALQAELTAEQEQEQEETAETEEIAEYGPTACCYDDTPLPALNSRYASIGYPTDEEIDLVASIVWLEAGSVSAECQRCCAEVIFNRVVSEKFPSTITEVIYQNNPTTQFTTVKRLSKAQPNGDTYQIVLDVLYQEPVTDSDVLYFSLAGENSREWRTIDGVVFCRG